MTNFQKIYNILGPWRKQYLAAALLLAFSAIVRMIEPKALQIAVDSLVATHEGKALPTGSDAVSRFFYRILPINTEPANPLVTGASAASSIVNILIFCALIYVFLSAIRALTWFWSGQMTARATENAAFAFRNRLFRHIQLMSFTAFDKIPTAEIIQRTTGDIGTVRDFIATQITEVVLMSFYFFGALAMMWGVDWQYALISVGIVPLIVIYAFIFFKKEGDVWEAHEKEQDKLTAIVNENLNGIRVVQAFAREEFEIEKFTKQNQAKLKVALRHVNLHKWFWSVSDTMIYLQVAISIVVGGYFVLNQRITLGEFTTFFTYAMTVTWPLRNVGRIVSQAGMTFVAMQRISEVLDADEEVYQSENPNTPSVFQPIRGDIEFRNVFFRYKNEEKWVLENVSFSIKAGEKVGILGGTGAGKSTIIALLSRFYEPTEGTIFLDDKNLNTYDKTFLRSKLGAVHQKAFLFSTTIQENIAFTDPDLDIETVKSAGQKSAVEHFIEKMPDGYATIVGEKGVSLSGGQRQRVALARTLLSNPDILILDDATSAVDTETELFIQEELSRFLAEKTAIIIAYRMTTIQNVDKIIVLDKGQVVQMGSHEALLTENGFYKTMHDIQTSVEKDIEQELLVLVEEEQVQSNK